MREDGCDSFLNQLILFCRKYDIHVPRMEENYLVASQKNVEGMKLLICIIIVLNCFIRC